jgi:hypothetical protein
MSTRPLGTKFLPEFDVELPARRAPAHQTTHDHAFRHTTPIYCTGGKSIAGLLAKKPTGNNLKPAS